MRTLHVDTWDNWFIMLTTSELEALSAKAPHGTHARYNAHLLAGEKPCHRCKDGEATYRAELRAKRLEDRSGAEASHRHAFARTASSRIEDEEQDDEDEEFDPDEQPRVRRSEVLAAPGFGPAWESMNGFFGWKGPKPSRSTLAPASKRKRSTPEDPRTRLRAITAELDSGGPRGSAAVKLLVEATRYLTGGVTALRQYGEARRCHPSEVAAAERAVIGKEER